MPCFAVLCYAMFLCIMLCYVSLCYVMIYCSVLCYAMFLCVMSWYVVLCYVMLCYAVVLCYAMCYGFMLCDVAFCYLLYCYVPLCCVLFHLSCLRLTLSSVPSSVKLRQVSWTNWNLFLIYRSVDYFCYCLQDCCIKDWTYKRTNTNSNMLVKASSNGTITWLNLSITSSWTRGKVQILPDGSKLSR